MMVAVPGSDRPRFRQDLVAELVEDHGAKFIDVMDPDSGSVFRFYEVEFSLACAMDGERDVAGLVRWAQEELGVTPSATEVRSVIATLGDLGYLSATAPDDAVDDATQVGADIPLASGVVVGVQPKLDITSEVVLGQAGSTAPAPAGSLPKAPDLALGHAGPSAMQRPRAPAEDIALGGAGAAGDVSDVSLDLSEHIAVKPADVKEAVRQSKVMQAVDVPPELLEPAQPVERPAAAPVRPTPQPTPAKPPTRPTPPPMPAATPPAVEAKPVEVKPVEARPAAKPAAEVRPAAKPAVELRPVPEKQPVAPPAPQRRVSPALIVLLILVVVGVVGFLIWKYVIDQTNGSDQASTSTVKPPSPPPAPTPAPVPARPVVNGKVEMAAGSTKAILSVFAGTVEWIEAEKDVKSGDIVMKLVGLKQLETTIATLQKDVDKRLADVENIRKARDAAESAGNEAAKKTEQARLDVKEPALTAKQQLLADKKDKLEEYVIRVILDGKFTPTAKQGQKVPEAQPIATLQPAPTPSVTFQMPDETRIEAGTLMSLSVVGAEKKHIDCTVAESKVGTLRFTCPADTAEGTPVSFQLP